MTQYWISQKYSLQIGTKVYGGHTHTDRMVISLDLHVSFRKESRLKIATILQLASVVRPSTCNNLRTRQLIFTKFDTGEFE
jgi:hypothetical protein